MLKKLYFTLEEYENYMNGSLAIGYSESEFEFLRIMESHGIDCKLKESPLNHMTKIPQYQTFPRFEGTGYYVLRGKQMDKWSKTHINRLKNRYAI
ncbi:MAG TPA: hypothetical protein VE710_18280 [Candidatus Bathyarchaeia archaeon]|nr:hypothetical protein [Candidatus Bathyarchaeia archaeon]